LHRCVRVLHLDRPVHHVHVLRGCPHSHVSAYRCMGVGTQGVLRHEADTDADGRLRLPAYRYPGYLLRCRSHLYEPIGNSTDAQYSHRTATYLVPAHLPRFRCAGRSVPVPHMEPRRSRLRTDCRIHAPCRCIDETGRLRMFPHSHVPDARSCTRTGMDIPDSYRNLRGIRCILRLCTNRLEVYQCLLFRQPLRPGVVRHPDDEPDSLHGCCSADALSRTDDSLVLRPYRYDIRTYPYA